MMTQFGRSLLSVRAAYGGSPMTMKIPTGAMDLGEALGLLKGARGAMIWHGNEEVQMLEFAD
jgi:hypothetical protein